MSRAVQAVPVFAKVMGIALALTLIFGVVMHWEIGRTRQRLLATELAQPADEAHRRFIREHVGLEAELLTRRLAVVMALTAACGMGLAWYLARLLTRPLQEILAGTQRLEQGQLQNRIPVRADDEIGELAAAFNKMAAALEQKETARQRLLRRAIEAGEEERKRLARELHDQTSQVLTALIASLGALETQARDPEQRRALVSLQQLAAQTLGEIRDVARALRPAALDDLGLVDALQQLCATSSERFGKPIQFHSEGWEQAPRLPAELEVTLYRITQEALTNAARHAQAKRILVLVQRRSAEVLVIVEDDGRGFDLQQRNLNGDKLGLLGIEERAALVGGQACVESTPGGGTQVTASIPVPTT